MAAEIIRLLFIWLDGAKLATSTTKSGQSVLVSMQGRAEGNSFRVAPSVLIDAYLRGLEIFDRSLVGDEELPW